MSEHDKNGPFARFGGVEGVLRRPILPGGMPAGAFLSGPGGAFQLGVTPEEYKLALGLQSRSATAAFQKKVTELVGMGQAPQQAILQALQTPEGQAFFEQSGDNLGTVVEAIRGALIQPTELRSPGQESVPVGAVGRTPTAQVQTAMDLATLAGNEPGTPGFQQIMRDAMSASGTTERERATKYLVDNGVISQLEGQKSLADQVMFTPSTIQRADPATGVVTSVFQGLFIYDKTTGVSRFVSAGDMPQAVQAQIAAGTGRPVEETGAAPGTVPVPAPAPAPSVSEIFGEGSDPSIMFAGVGLVPAAIEVLGGMGEQIDPRISAGVVANQRAAIRNLRTAVLGLTASGNSRLKIVADEYMKVLPSTGIFEGPQNALRGAIEFRSRIARMRDEARQVFQASTGPEARSVKNRTEADQDIRAIDTVLSAMPTEEQMKNRLELFEAGKGGALTIRNAVEILGSAGIKLLGDAGLEEPSHLYGTFRKGGAQSITLEAVQSTSMEDLQNFVLSATPEELDKLSPEVRAAIGQRLRPAPGGQ